MLSFSKKSRSKLKRLKLSRRSQEVLSCAGVGSIWLHHTGYAYTKLRGKNRPLHRVLAEALGWEIDGKEIDHRNNDRLDNRINNLRIATKAQNRQNIGLTRANSSGYKGVAYYKKIRKWAALIGKPRWYLGVFNTKEEAARAYNRAARKRFGKFAKLNLIRDKQ